MKLISPFAPHIAEELWSILGNKKSIVLSVWPKVDINKVKESKVIIVVQINGKARSSFECDIDIDEDNARNMALDMSEIRKWTEGKEIKKVIYIKNRVINIVS